MNGRTSKHARLGALLCGAAAVSMGVVSCTTRGGNGGTAGRQSYVQQANAALAAGQTPWFCKSQGLGGNMEGEHSGNGTGLANDAYRGRSKGTLSAADCRTNAQLFDKALAYAMRYPTKGAAERAGFIEMVQFIQGMGSHNMTLSIGGPQANPFFLQYDGEAGTAPIAGMSWFTFSALGPPQGFAGNNDWWHSHTSLCYTGRAQLDDLLPGAPIFGVGGNEISDAACRAKGGINLRLPGIWMAHAWIIPGYEDHYDVFAGASACVKGQGRPPAANDPCHNTPMDMDHGHGDGGAMPGMDRGFTPTTRRTLPTIMPRVTTTRRTLPTITMPRVTTTRRTLPTVTLPRATTTMAPMPGMDHGGMDHGH